MRKTVPSPFAAVPGKSDYSDGLVGIRRFRTGDAVPLYIAARESIEKLSAWMTWCGEDYSTTDGAAFVSACDAAWEKGERYSFVIFDPRSEMFLGSIGLSRIDRTHQFANLGYWVRQSRTGCGVASASVRLITRFAFEQLGLHRIEMVIPTSNYASQRVAEKAGALREGILRNRLMLQGTRHDAFMYALFPAQADPPVSDPYAI